MGVLALGVIALILLRSDATRVGYHKWRLSEARQNARTAGAGKPTAVQELLALFGKSRSADDYAKAWLRHEEALVKLNVLMRREFLFARRVGSEDRYHIAEAGEREFGPRQLWSVSRGGSNEHTVIVTAPPADMLRWEGLLRRISEDDQSARSYGSLRSRRTFAW